MTKTLITKTCINPDIVGVIDEKEIWLIGPNGNGQILHLHKVDIERIKEYLLWWMREHLKANGVQIDE